MLKLQSADTSKEQPIGILEHAIILAKGEEWPKKSLREL